MTRVAAIDVGTNSVLLLVADHADARLTPVVERATITRLGQGVDQARALHPDAVARTKRCLEDYHAQIEAAEVDRVAIVGTSALRDAGGGREFIDDISNLFGVPFEVISGDREASLSFAGATSGMGLQKDVAVFDIGGGSTEFIFATRSESAAGDSPTEEYELLRAISLDVGSVRLTERFVRNDPASDEELDDIRRYVAGLLATVPRLGERDWQWIGVAGTVTTVSALTRGLTRYDATRVHGSTLDLAQVRSLIDRLRVPFAERVKIPCLEPGRADVIVAGTVLLEQVMVRGGGTAEKAMLVSDRGVRWGLALELARAASNPSSTPAAC